MWFGGTTDPRMRIRPAKAEPLAGLPSVWTSPTYQGTPLVVPYSERGSGLVVMGTCGADEYQVRRAIAHGVPDDVAWRWPGSYIAAEITPGGVTLWTDLGATPLYTRHTAHGHLVWGSSARLLASLDGDPDINLDHVADALAGRRVEGTYFTHVGPVAFGHKVRLSARNVDQRPLWRPSVTEGTDHNHGQRLRAALEGAVAVRVDSSRRPTTDFSGGFDSTALGLVAAERLARKDEYILGVTLHPEGVYQGGDLDYAREAVPDRGLRHAWMPLSKEHLPYRGLDLVPATDEPAPSTASYAYFSGQMVWLAEQGSDMHMTGDGGDGLLLTPPGHIARVLRRGNFRLGLGEAARWAHIRRTSIWRALSTVRSVPQVHTPFDLDSPTHHAVIQSRMIAARTARADVEIAHGFGVRLHNPYFDAQVIDTYLSIPESDLPGPTRYKPILVEAMRDLFPARLAQRTTKGDASSDHYGGLRQALPTLTGFIDGHLSGAGLIDPAEIRKRMHYVAAGVGDMSLVRPVIETEAWLRAVRSAPILRWGRRP
ncbi:albusnodin/ikarugamycin family macrolactam cyclase [Nocardiopsis synnemataformans]|uniref:albusnodin/ikarugamycin family macrolactam cyclase n=1 Tax=Nocardiopsis synnemataformans TaxID=61305 RepID=UPI003EBF5B65